MRESPALTVDAVIVEGGEVVLIKRRNPPFQGRWAIPGGFVEYGERVEDAVVREAREETGLEIKIDKLIGVYSDPERDPRGHTVSIVFLCKAVGGQMKAGSDAMDVEKFNLNELPKLAFDHRLILEDVKGRI